MASVKSRLTVLRELLNLSQIDFADQIGITQGALSQLEAGKSRLSLASIKKVSIGYKVNCNWLINGDGDIFLKEQSKSKVPSKQVIVTKDLKESALIPLIREEAHAGYINGYQDTDYLHTLDVYKIPGYEQGNYRLFEIEGDSMLPSIQPREIVVSEYVEEWETIENGTICVVISEKGIVAKRAYFYEEDRGTLILKSDNAKFKTYAVNLSDVLEIWEVRAKISHNLFNPEDGIESVQMQNMQSDLHDLKEKVAQLVQNQAGDLSKKNK